MPRSFCAPLSVHASIGSDEFCSDNPSHFACDGKVGADKDDNEDDPDYRTESDLSEEEKDEKKEDAIGTCYGSGYNDGQNGSFDESVYKDNCYGEYYEGVIDGCIGAGNTRDVCESATDA